MRNVLLIWLAAMFTSSCDRVEPVAVETDVRGAAINSSSTNAVPVLRNTNTAASPRAPQLEDGYLRLSFDDLSNFKFDTYEVLDEVHGGRPLTKSDDVIPPHVKAHDGRKVIVEGFIMPLRLRKGLVTEFLLFRDQASCCFGAQAKMNHYIRVKVTGKGFEPGSTLTHKVWGTLDVGEIYVQEYLTGIYQMDAERVEVVD